MPEDTSDETLVLRMMDRDEGALRLFLVAHEPKVRAALRSKYREVLVEPEIDEAMNMAAYKAYRNADRFDGFKGTLRGWFYTIALRAAQDIIRREQRHWHGDSAFSPLDTCEASGAGELDPSDRAESRQVSALKRAIQTELTPSEKRVIEADLAAGDGGIADSARLAEMMGSTVGSIHTLRSRARKKIQQYMLNQGHYQSTQRSKP